VLAKMRSDSGTCSTIAITLLKQEDIIKASYLDQSSDRGVSFLGTSLYSLNGADSAHAVSGTTSRELGEVNARQNIIMEDLIQLGTHLTYDEKTGCVQVEEEGNYLMGLTLSSNGSSYASLKVDDFTLGLGDDTHGQGMMSNSAIMHLQEGACIVPQLEPLSQIYGVGNWSQLFVTSIPDDSKSDAFCYGLSQPLFNENSAQVPFDFPILANPNFDSHGSLTIADEDFNPRRFYLVFVNAFMASGTLTLELNDSDQDAWEAISEEVASSTARRMVSIMRIVEMDNFKNMLRVKSIGLLDEGDNHFATFCGMRIGQ